MNLLIVSPPHQTMGHAKSQRIPQISIKAQKVHNSSQVAQFNNPEIRITDTSDCTTSSVTETQIRRKSDAAQITTNDALKATQTTLNPKALVRCHQPVVRRHTMDVIPLATSAASSLTLSPVAPIRATVSTVNIYGHSNFVDGSLYVDKSQFYEHLLLATDAILVGTAVFSIISVCVTLFITGYLIYKRLCG